MSDSKWVYEKATGKWMLAFRDPSIYLTDAVNYGIIDLGLGSKQPDPIYERADVTLGRRPATAAEITESKAEAANVLAVSEIDGNKALIAVARVLYKYLPAGKPATFMAFALEVKALYITL